MKGIPDEGRESCAVLLVTPEQRLVVGRRPVLTTLGLCLSEFNSVTLTCSLTIVDSLVATIDWAIQSPRRVGRFGYATPVSPVQSAENAEVAHA